MDIGELDPITGRTTTGHEWNGIKELNTPVPKVVLFFLAAGTLFAIGYWIAMPAWPLWSTYTKGLLGIDQRHVVTQQVEAARAERSVWMDKIAAMDFAAIKADPTLMANVTETGKALFGENCAVCHGVKATGGPGFPDLTAGAWLWGGDPDVIAETIRVGINSTDADTRVSQMLAFGKDGLLDRQQISDVVAYVRSLSAASDGSTPEQLAAGQKVFAETCASCHGENGKGLTDFGAPDLTDAHWIYGGSAGAIYETVYAGRQGHMPHWSERMTPAEIKLLALYVEQLAAPR